MLACIGVGKDACSGVIKSFRKINQTVGDMTIDHKAQGLGINSIYKINMGTKQIQHHTYNQQNDTWSCTMYQGEAPC